MTKLRLSSHDLEIKKGRYRKPKLQVEDGISTLCPCGAIEDEWHVLVACTFSEIDCIHFMSICKTMVKRWM